jgi:hypothetical protein
MRLPDAMEVHQGSDPGVQLFTAKVILGLAAARRDREQRSFRDGT